MARCFVLSLVFLFSLTVDHSRAEEADKIFIRQTFGLALSAIEQGNHPFGAILVKDGRVIIRSSNTVRTDDYFAHHAEINALATAIRKQGLASIKGATLYTSCEPCAMCCAAIYMTGVKRLVYGLSAAKLSALTGFDKPYPSREFFKLVGNEIEITGPLMEEDAAKVVSKFMHITSNSR